MPNQTDIISDVRSFMKSRGILTAAELDLFTKLDQILRKTWLKCLTWMNGLQQEYLIA